MPSRSEWQALGAFAILGWRRAAAEPLTILARAALYVLVLAIFWAFWRATPLTELHRQDLTPERLIWYLAISEWIVFATGMPYREIEEDIRSGALATGLSRPLGYAPACLAQWGGATAFRLPVFVCVGLLTALAFTHTVPLAPLILVEGLLASALAAALYLLCQLMIGLATTWVGSAAPVHWIWQKGLFVLGGLIIPLSLYPASLRSWAAKSPFAAMLSAPASLALDASQGHARTVFALQAAWLAVLAVLAWLVDRSATARLITRGL